jgi:hypothetical protein
MLEQLQKFLSYAASIYPNNYHFCIQSRFRFSMFAQNINILI